MKEAKRIQGKLGTENYDIDGNRQTTRRAGERNYHDYWESR